MKKESVKEGLEVTFKETNEDSVKELYFSVNTGDSGIVSYSTPEKINGMLKCVVIKADGQVQIELGLAEYNIILWDTKQFSGTRYLPLRIAPIDVEDTKFNFAPQEWALNNRLIARVNGPKFSNVEFIVRWV